MCRNKHARAWQASIPQASSYDILYIGSSRLLKSHGRRLLAMSNVWNEGSSKSETAWKRQYLLRNEVSWFTWCIKYHDTAWTALDRNACSIHRDTQECVDLSMNINWSRTTTARIYLCFMDSIQQHDAVYPSLGSILEVDMLIRSKSRWNSYIYREREIHTTDTEDCESNSYAFLRFSRYVMLWCLVTISKDDGLWLLHGITVDRI